MELLNVLEDWNGFKAVSESRKPENYAQRLKETLDLLSNAAMLPSHRHEFLIREAFTTSDFPLLFGDVLDRQVLAAYREVEPVWKQYFRQSMVRDFRLARRYAITGGDQYLAPVTEKGEYPISERGEAKYDIQVKKYGRQFDVSWETLINDDMGALKGTPERFARAAVRTEHRLAVSTYANDLGTHAAGNLYQNGVNAHTRPLTIQNLEASLSDMAAFLDANGEPILNRAKFLVVGPDLEFAARAILTSAVKMWTDESANAGTGGITPFPMTNVLPQVGLQLVVDPYLPIFGAPGYTKRSWYLFADPAEIAAVEFAHLLGHDRPEICMKASDKIYVGGSGDVGPMSGDFASDNVLYRVLLVAGTAKLDWRATFHNKVAD